MEDITRTIQDSNEIEIPSVDLHKEKEYFFPSIQSTIVIRQLPSQGLSFQLWPAATTLVTLLDIHRCHPATPISPFLTRPLKILELGSGTGLVGISAAAILGAKVTLTDLPHVLPNLQFNADINSTAVRLNGGEVTVEALGWGEVADMERVGRDFDVVLGSDVVYYDCLYGVLIDTLRFLLVGGEKKVVFVMGHLKRWKKEASFFRKAKKYFDVEVVYRETPADGDRVGVLVYSFLGKSGSESNKNRENSQKV